MHPHRKVGRRGRQKRQRGQTESPRAVERLGRFGEIPCNSLGQRVPAWNALSRGAALERNPGLGVDRGRAERRAVMRCLEQAGDAVLLR